MRLAAGALAVAAAEAALLLAVGTAAVGLRLPEEEEPRKAPRLRDRLKRLVHRLDPFHDH